MWQEYDKAAYTAHQQQQEADRRRQEEQQRQRYQDEQRRMMEQQRQQQENMRRQSEAMRNQTNYSPTASSTTGFNPSYSLSSSSNQSAGNVDHQQGGVLMFFVLMDLLAVGIVCCQKYGQPPWLFMVGGIVAFLVTIWLFGCLPRWITMPTAFLLAAIPSGIIAAQMHIDDSWALGIALILGTCNAVSASNFKKVD